MFPIHCTACALTRRVAIPAHCPHVVSDYAIRRALDTVVSVAKRHTITSADRQRILDAVAVVRHAT